MRDCSKKRIVVQPENIPQLADVIVIKLYFILYLLVIFLMCICSAKCYWLPVNVNITSKLHFCETIHKFK